MSSRLLPSWLTGYRRAWLRPDLIAGIVVWSVVTPQAVAYAQIAGLPPQAGLLAAPGALLAYALLGTSRTLVVGATTATAAVSAAAIAPLADGDAGRFAVLSAALAIAAAVVFVGAGLLRLGAIADFVSKPVMTGFLFGLGLSIAIGQLPKLLGIPHADGTFVQQLGPLLDHLGDVDVTTLVVGAASVAVLLAGRTLAPAVPATLVVLGGSIAVSAALGLDHHGVAVVGEVPAAWPHPSIPSVSAHDWVQLLGSACGVLLLSAEGLGVARTLAQRRGDPYDVNRDLIAFGGSNLLAGLSQGFVESGGSSQTAAAQRAGGQTQLASIVAAVLVVVTGGLLTGLFADLPEATLGAIVIVAVAGFARVDELRRFARIRTSAIVFSLIALGGVLVLGVLPGLIVAAGGTLADVVRHLGHPPVGALARDPLGGGWGLVARHPDWVVPSRVLAVRSDGPIFYPNVNAFQARVLALLAGLDPPPLAVVIDLAETPDLDIQTLDMLDELQRTLGPRGIELRVAPVRVKARDRLRRAGLEGRVVIAPTLDAAAGIAHGG